MQKSWYCYVGIVIPEHTRTYRKIVFVGRRLFASTCVEQLALQEDGA